MIKIYPALFHAEDGGYWVEFPDLDGCNTEGDTLEQAYMMAQEALGLYLATMLDDQNRINEPSKLESIMQPADGFANYVLTDVDEYRKNVKAIRKTVSIPEWLAAEAEKKNLSLSKVLQDGLKEQIM